MITMSAEIEIFQGESFDNVNISITDSNGSDVQSNISANISNIFSKIKPKFSKQNPFIIGSSVLSGGATFSNGEQYFITNCFSSATKDENSNIYPFENDIIITMESKDYVLGVLPTVFSILFDVSDNVYAPQIIINGYNDLDVKQWTNTYLPETAYFTVANLDNSNCVRYEIIISGLNKPNSQLILLGVYSQLSIYADKRNLISLDSDIKDRSDNGHPSYGIISNGGNLTMIDNTGEIKAYAEFGLLTSDLPVTLYLHDTLSGKKEIIGVFETENWEYNTLNFEVNITLKDNLEELQNINMERIPLDPLDRFAVFHTMADLYKILKKETPDSFKFDDFNYLDENVKTLLTSSYLEYPLLENDSLWEQWRKICETCQLYIYADKDGKTVCRYYGGD